MMGKYVEYQHHANGIHEYILLTSKQEVIDEQFALMRLATKAKFRNKNTPPE